MRYNLTEKQKALARFIVESVRHDLIGEEFYVSTGPRGFQLSGKNNRQVPAPSLDHCSQLRCLEEAGLLLVDLVGGASLKTYILTAGIYRAVDSNFAEDEDPVPISTLAQPHPPEISMSLDRLRARYPDPKKLGFLIMRFSSGKPHAKIVETVQRIGEEHGLSIVRADHQEFHADLWGNVRTYLHGCGFGIAIYERIESNTPNANVGLEVGYLLAMNKPVLLLKDKTLETIQADLAGKLYKSFDPHDPESTIPDQMTKWLTDYGIVVKPPIAGKS